MISLPVFLVGVIVGAILAYPYALRRGWRAGLKFAGYITEQGVEEVIIRKEPGV